MKCLRENSFESARCRHASKEYLECRMDRRVPRAPRPAPPRAPGPAPRGGSMRAATKSDSSARSRDPVYPGFLPLPPTRFRRAGCRFPGQ